MGLGKNAADEFCEEILYGAAYVYVFPEVRKWIDQKFPDEIDPETKRTKRNIMKDAIESSLNVIMMGVMFMIIRYQEQFLEKLFAISRSASLFIYSGGKQVLDKLREGIKSRRGVSAINRMNKYGDSMSQRIEMAKHIQMQTDSVINARDSQYNSTSIYTPAAQIQDTAVQRERLYEQLGDSKTNARLQLAMFKMLSGSFTPADYEVLKNIYKTIDPTGQFDPSKVDVNRLNKISEFMFVTDNSGKIVGLTDAFMSVLNGMGYIHKANSTGGL
jgi:hypothetical protein